MQLIVLPKRPNKYPQVGLGSDLESHPHLKVQAVSSAISKDFYYQFAAYFQYPFWKGHTTEGIQIVRMIMGMCFSIMICDELFLGPNDFTGTLANMNFWGITVSLASLVYQFKSANYEMQKQKALDKTLWPYSIWYKKAALQSLEIAHAINISVAFGFFFFIFPNTGYANSPISTAFQDQSSTYNYWQFRMFTMHLLPVLLTTFQIFMSDIVFMETDWWLPIVVALIYILVNWTLTTYNKKTMIYYMDWSMISKITPFSPIVSSAGIIIISTTSQFYLSMLTQVVNQRYVFNFKNYSTTGI